MNKTIFKRSVALALTLSALLVPMTQSSAQSLDEIRAAGKVRIGLQLDNPPFGIVDGQGNPDGYEADVAKLYAEKLGVPLEIVSITGPNRIPYLLTGRVDVLIAALSITEDRAKQVQFSNPYATVDMLVFGETGLHIASVQDLDGVSIAVPRASAQDLAVAKQAPAGTNIQRFDDDPAASQALLSGQVQTIAATTTVVSQIEKVAPAGAYDTKFALYSAVFGMAVRPGQEELKTWTNDFIAGIVADGSLSAINNKWFGKDLRPLTAPDYVK